MATGRTVQKYTRLYSGGYDLSGFGRSIGPLEIAHDEANLTVWTDAFKGYLKDKTHVNVGTLNAVFDNTATTGIHALLGTADALRDLVVAYGIRAAPAAGDPAFLGQFRQSAYQTADDGGALTVNIPFLGWDGAPTSRAYSGGWGYLLHAYGAETAANAGTGIDCYQQTQTTNGGFLAYQLFTSNAAGTVTLSVDDSADNAAFLPLSGATTSAIGFASIPTAGVVAIGNTATVRRYLRWQLAFTGGMTTCTFVSAFFRA